MAEPSRIPLQPGLTACDAWARRHAATGPGLALLAVDVYVMYGILRSSQSNVPALVYLPLGFAIFGFLMIAAVALVLVLEGSVAGTDARRAAPADLRADADGVVVEGGPAHGRRLTWAELATARIIERTRPGRGVWRNLKDVVLQRRRDRVPDEPYVDLTVTTQAAPLILAEAVGARARVGLTAALAWMTGPLAARVDAGPEAGEQARRRHGVTRLASATAMDRWLRAARVPMVSAYPALAIAAWVLGAQATLPAIGLVLVAGLAVIGASWLAVRPAALARAAWQGELADAATDGEGPTTSPWRQARRQARLGALALTAAVVASGGALAASVTGRTSADARACSRGDHAACIRRATAIGRRDPAAAVALLAPGCTPPVEATVRRCEALAATLMRAPPPVGDVAGAERLYRATCSLGHDSGCTLRRALCAHARALPGCADIPAEGP